MHFSRWSAEPTGHPLETVLISHDEGVAEHYDSRLGRLFHVGHFPNNEYKLSYTTVCCGCTTEDISSERNNDSV